MEAIVQAILRNHPELASWLLSNQYVRNFSPGDLKKAFPTLRFHRTGDAIIKALTSDPASVRRGVSLASGFDSGSDMARLGSMASKARGIGSLSPLGAIAGMAAPEAIGMLRDDRAAQQSVQGMERNRAVNRSLDRELRRTGPSPYEQEIGRVQGTENWRRQLPRPEAPPPPLPEANVDMYEGMSPYAKNIADVYGREAARRAMPRPERPADPVEVNPIDIAMPLMQAMYPDLDPIEIRMSLEEAMLPELLADELTARQLPEYEFVKRPMDIKVPPVKPLKKRAR